MLGKAISITAKAFEGKTDKGGTPYILHCIHVMNAVREYGEDAMCVGIMHDLVEDTDYTIENIVEMGFSREVCYSLSLMTHDMELPYDDYIKLIATNEIARRVKLADLRHNSDILRMKGLRKKDFDRLEKYHKAFMYLSD